jgi:hypothetical protein
MTTARALQVSCRIAIPAVALVAGPGEFDAVDHHQPQPVEEGGDGQEEGIGIRDAESQHQMEGDRDSQQPARLGEQPGGDGIVHGGFDTDIREHHDRHREEQQEQLDIAAAARAERGYGAHRLVPEGVGVDVLDDRGGRVVEVVEVEDAVDDEEVGLGRGRGGGGRGGARRARGGRGLRRDGTGAARGVARAGGHTGLGLIAQLGDAGVGIGPVVGGDAVLHDDPVGLRQVRHGDIADGHRRRQAHRPEVVLHPLKDGDLALGLADEELLLGPGVCRVGTPRDHHGDRGDRPHQLAQPAAAGARLLLGQGDALDRLALLVEPELAGEFGRLGGGGLPQGP